MASSTLSMVSTSFLVSTATAKPAFSLRSQTFGSSIRMNSLNLKKIQRSFIVKASATPEELKEKVVASIANAEEVCDGGSTGECAAAWDEVEEISAAAQDARLKEKYSDPLEKYCADNPETDECRVYED